MPTFSHPTGNRAHLMNVYTNSNYRRQGVARKLVQMLIDEARGKGDIAINQHKEELACYKITPKGMLQIHLK